VFAIYHQNIQGLKGKADEIMLSLISRAPNIMLSLISRAPNIMLSLISRAPNIICLTEHHLMHSKIDNAWIPNYKLAANYTRNSLKCGGVCIFIRDHILGAVGRQGMWTEPILGAVGRQGMWTEPILGALGRQGMWTEPVLVAVGRREIMWTAVLRVECHSETFRLSAEGSNHHVIS
jgi:hypothetical protein